MPSDALSPTRGKRSNQSNLALHPTETSPVPSRQHMPVLSRFSAMQQLADKKSQHKAKSLSERIIIYSVFVAIA